MNVSKGCVLAEYRYEIAFYELFLIFRFVHCTKFHPKNRSPNISKHVSGHKSCSLLVNNSRWPGRFRLKKTSRCAEADSQVPLPRPAPVDVEGSNLDGIFAPKMSIG